MKTIHYPNKMISHLVIIAPMSPFTPKSTSKVEICLLCTLVNFIIPTRILIDLSRAFDTLDHGILLSKLQYYGITGIELNFFYNYLSGKIQYVDYFGFSSDTLPNKMVVPQGSILGTTTIFNLYK